MMKDDYERKDSLPQEGLNHDGNNFLPIHETNRNIKIESQPYTHANPEKVYEFLTESPLIRPITYRKDSYSLENFAFQETDQDHNYQGANSNQNTAMTSDNLHNFQSPNPAPLPPIHNFVKFTL